MYTKKIIPGDLQGNDFSVELQKEKKLSQKRTTYLVLISYLFLHIFKTKT